ncbi:hypothetical protein WR25_26996 isoform B [Diploscapter pachys]|uniref:Transmembrane protein 144 n=1 Tax=Diploscapter pachys TaxID=2018661 RepID=A0A2A2L7Q2_9BILA|nr:hypothetical protein WR25_26996 isoform A [Diploscapter pachys]PAV82077.1 hypothetical protein WR25_26996 isoform B [Diploscapter pachys]
MGLEIGLAACGVCLVFFGSMFVPVRSCDSGDGIFVQWLMSLAILIVGFFTFWIQNFPGFYPLAMLGGAFWTIGNATAIPIMHRIGMAMGMLIWNTANCTMGWAGGRFGLFGMKANIPASPILNYAGLACVIIGGILFSQVKSTPAEANEQKKAKRHSEDIENSAEKQALNPNPGSDTDDAGDVQIAVPAKQKENTVSEKEKIGAILLSLLAGAFYGNTFVPVIYMTDHPEIFVGYPTDQLSYVFSHFFGIFLTATVIFVFYAIFK